MHGKKKTNALAIMLTKSYYSVQKEKRLQSKQNMISACYVESYSADN